MIQRAIIHRRSLAFLLLVPLTAALHWLATLRDFEPVDVQISDNDASLLLISERKRFDRYMRVQQRLDVFDVKNGRTLLTTYSLPSGWSNFCELSPNGQLLGTEEESYLARIHNIGKSGSEPVQWRTNSSLIVAGFSGDSEFLLARTRIGDPKVVALHISTGTISEVRVPFTSRWNHATRFEPPLFEVTEFDPLTESTNGKTHVFLFEDRKLVPRNTLGGPADAASGLLTEFESPPIAGNKLSPYSASLNESGDVSIQQGVGQSPTVFLANGKRRAHRMAWVMAALITSLWLCWLWAKRRDRRSWQPLIDASLCFSLLTWACTIRVAYDPLRTPAGEPERTIIAGCLVAAIWLLQSWIVFSRQRWSRRVTVGLLAVLAATASLGLAQFALHHELVSETTVKLFSVIPLWRIVSVAIVWLLCLACMKALGLEIRHNQDRQDGGEKGKLTIRDLGCWCALIAITFAIAVRLETESLPTLPRTYEIFAATQFALIAGAASWLVMGSSSPKFRLSVGVVGATVFTGLGFFIYETDGAFHDTLLWNLLSGVAISMTVVLSARINGYRISWRSPVSRSAVSVTN